MKKLNCVLIMAGGTGGHVFPGLAVANYLRERGIAVHWLGTSLGLEARVVPEAQIPLHVVSVGGLRGKGLKPLLLGPFRILGALWQSIRVIQKVQPDVVFGLGGYVSGPGGVAAWLLRRPLIIHEQNAKAGLTNKILGRLAKVVLAGFPMAFKPQANAITIGNPVRAEIAQLPAPNERLDPARVPLRVLVIGGSLGAQALNDVVPRALAQLTKEERPEVFHQTGDKFFYDTKKTYESMGIRANLQPFIKDMSQAYAWADIVVCRAGALTVAELCAVGLGAVLVPFPYAVDDHQTANADYMVKSQAAVCIQQSELTAKRLADIVRQFIQSPAQCLAMAQAAYGLRKTDVTEKIFNICQEVVL